MQKRGNYKFEHRFIFPSSAFKNGVPIFGCTSAFKLLSQATHLNRGVVILHYKLTLTRYVAQPETPVFAWGEPQWSCVGAAEGVLEACDRACWSLKC